MGEQSADVSARLLFSHPLFSLRTPQQIQQSAYYCSDKPLAPLNQQPAQHSPARHGTPLWPQPRFEN